MPKDTFTESEMSDTKYDVMTSCDHKVVLVQINGEDISLFSPKEAREYGEALIRAADKVEKANEPKAEPVKPAAVPVAVKTA
jgi:hypothetical protein